MKTRPESIAPVDFAETLREELIEIDKLRGKRRWNYGRDMGDAAETESIAAVHAENELPEEQSAPVENDSSGKRKRIPKENADKIFKDAHRKSLVGLSFSGGGIRSATFNLGVLQGLANLRLLPMFDYLSTVSGGGYIGSWLSAWILRAGQDSRGQCENPLQGKAAVSPVRRVQEFLRPDRSAKPDHGEPRPIRFLREYSNYLTPRLGFLSGDTWTAVAIYVRNLFLNQLILVFFLSSVLLLPHIAVWITRRTLLLGCLPHARFFGPVAAFLLVLLALIFVALNMKHLTGISGTSGYYFKWYARQGSILALVVTPLFFAAWIASATLGHEHLSDTQYWPLLGGAAFALLWAVSSLANLPKRGTDAPHWSSTGAWAWSIIFSFVSGGVGGFLLWELANRILYSTDNYETVGIWRDVSFGPPLVIAIFLVVGALQIGFIGLYFPDPRREWWARLGGYLLIISIAWTAAFSIAIFSPLALIWLSSQIQWAMVITWVGSTLTGIFAGKSSRTGSTESRSWTDAALSVTPYIFIVGVAVGISFLLETIFAWWGDACDLKVFLKGSAVLQKAGGWIVNIESLNRAVVMPTKRVLDSGAAYVCAHWNILYCGSNQNLVFLFIVFLGACVLLSWRININEFSMNLFYRNRLVRAYLGASHATRKPNPFTGFDPHDELQLMEIRADKCYSGPFPIYNSALNLVSGKDLAWQERKAESFVMTPLRCGFDTWLEQIDLQDDSLAPDKSPEIYEYGFRPTENYGFKQDGLRLGTAVSISGAAASPNMGYHSSPSLAFLMTLFNIRLGFWAGNPRHKTSWMNPGPQIGLLYILAELFGQTDDEANYVYLSDGGHFENLGLYELVKRRCKFIIVSDAGCDETFSFGDLGNAIRRCREDIGVEIDLETDHLIPILATPNEKNPGVTEGGSKTEKDKSDKWHWAVGVIHYELVDPGAEPGTLVYIKTSITGDEPSDILSYHREHPDFPHQTTTDQWFTESQFESYRRLGQHVVEQLFNETPGSSPATYGRLEGNVKTTKDVFESLNTRWSAKDSAKKSDAKPPS